MTVAVGVAPTPAPAAGTPASAAGTPASAAGTPASSYHRCIPDSVKSFVSDLYRYIGDCDGDVLRTRALYEDGFARLSALFYLNTPWPPAEAVAPYCNHDQVFLMLYCELRFRHAHARLPGLFLTHRADSWDNYCSLFGTFLQKDVSIHLPYEWLWDIIDEFISQFHKFRENRIQVEENDNTEDQSWNVHEVLGYFNALVKKSMIREILEKEKEGLEQFTMMHDSRGGTNVLKMLGYYSMIGLLRVYCLLGDYHNGLNSLSPIDISQHGVYRSVIGSYISTIYHYGFANFMMDRHTEVIYQFNKILLHMLKYKQDHQKSPQYELILKKIEQMYALLAICFSKCPQNNLIDEDVGIVLKEKYGTKMTNMLADDDDAYYDELLSFAFPKLITVSYQVLKDPFAKYRQCEHSSASLGVTSFSMSMQQLNEETQNEKMLKLLRDTMKAVSESGDALLGRQPLLYDDKRQRLYWNEGHPPSNPKKDELIPYGEWQDLDAAAPGGAMQAQIDGVDQNLILGGATDEWELFTIEDHLERLGLHLQGDMTLFQRLALENQQQQQQPGNNQAEEDDPNSVWVTG